MMQVKVGDEVGFGRWYSGRLQTGGVATVVQVNGHGHVTLSTGKVFDKHGRERGTGAGGFRLVPAEQIVSEQAAARRRRERNAAARQIEHLIRECRNGYGDLCEVNAETKQQMIDLITSL